MIFQYPNALNVIFDKLLQNSIRVIIVGGYVRDFFLDVDSKDIDIELYNISDLNKLESILSEFGNVNSVGKSFGVTKLSYKGYELDFSLPREDNKTGVGHKGFEIRTKPDLDFTTAANRRDFTTNAMGYDVENKTLLDPYDGIKDLKSKTLKAVNSKTFIEDPLRVLRGVGFCSRFGFVMDPDLYWLCDSMVKNSMLAQLSKERVFEEIKKILLKSPQPSHGLILLKKLGVLKMFQELDDLDTKQFNKQLKTLDNLKKNKLTHKLFALCYSFSENKVISLITKMTNDKTVLKNILLLTNNYKRIDEIYINGVSNYDIYKLAQDVSIKELITVNKAIHHKDERYFANNVIKSKAKELDVYDKKMQALIEGKDLIKLGLKPSALFSKILADIYEAQMREEFSNHKEALVWSERFIGLQKSLNFI